VAEEQREEQREALAAEEVVLAVEEGLICRRARN
jgi:hypothetical protein